MADDPNAKSVSINFDGGTVVMTFGMVKSLFIDDDTYVNPEGEDVSVAVKGHNRTRVIGGTSTPVAGYNYVYKSWPRLSGSTSAGGQAIMMRWDGSEGWWTARLHGSASDFGTFLSDKSPLAVEFKTERGTKYGPFKGTIL